MTCKICDSKRTKHLFTLEGRFGIYACGDCQVQFMDPQPNDQEITELYSETYYKSWGISGNTENEVSRRMKIATFELRLNEIRKHVKDGKVLDIGCATGFFLEAAKERDFEPYGIELSEYSSSLARKKFGDAAVFNGTLENAPFPAHFFQAITMFDLIEHVRNPIDTLRRANNLLNEKGLIVITTPNTDSLTNSFMGKKWTHYKKEHLYYFNLKSLAYISKKNNLEIIYAERSKKALNIDYLHTQLYVYKHWLFTPIIGFIHRVLPKAFTRKNIYLGIGEITVILKPKKSI